MSSFVDVGRGVRLVAVLVLALVVAACAQQQQQPGAGNVTPGSAQDFVVNVGDRIFFVTDSVTLTAQAQDTLRRQAQWLALYPSYTITMEGHADERGTREYNLALSARRAQVARDFLVSQGVQPTRIRTVSYGKERPVAVCNDESCWSQNRRAVTVVNNAPGS